jgi:membrane-bound lytic murein transglycosylase A
MPVSIYRWILQSGAVLLAAILAGCMSSPPRPQPPPEKVKATVRYEPAAWHQLPGWSTDRPQDAWQAFLNSCRARATQAPWQTVCEAAKAHTATDALSVRAFFERHFTPLRLVQSQGPGVDNDSGLITAYYEPLLRGSRKRTSTYGVPLYAPPADMLTIELGDLYPELKGKRLRGRLQGRKVVPYFDRAGLDGNPTLSGKEIVWVEDAVAAFFLEVQGSGRIQFADGQTIRLAYADQNGHPYRSIGRYLVDLGEMTLDQASAQSIRQWIREHPQREREVLNANPSVVFFREERIDHPQQGPAGALGVPLTPGRSIAVDPQFVPLGAPVFLATTQPNSAQPLQKLVMAQDTGGAIRGVVRADLFWGFGDAAGEFAGRMRQSGRMWLLWPKGAPLPQPAY